MKSFNKEHYLAMPIYRNEIIKLYKNKNSLEKIAKLVGHEITRLDIEKILDEEKIKRRTLEESMFKGNKIPTEKELHNDRKVKNMSTVEMGVKYGTPEKPVSANTVIRWLTKYDLYEGKKSRTEIPTKEELERDLNELGRSECRKKYHMNYGMLMGLIEEYGLDNLQKTERTVKKTKYIWEDKIRKTKPESLEKPIKIIKKKTVLEKYLENEKDLSMEHEAGFGD